MASDTQISGSGRDKSLIDPTKLNENVGRPKVDGRSNKDRGKLLANFDIRQVRPENIKNTHNLVSSNSSDRIDT